MSEERMNMLKDYLKYGKVPLMIQNVSASSFVNAIIIKASIERKKLTGHYENVEYCPPKWYIELTEKCKNNNTFLVIEKIDEIPEEEQTKFIEILKYKKISTFELPHNCLVVVTCGSLNTNKINEEVYSLLAQI